MSFSDVLVYSLGCSLPWGGIGILVFLVLRKKIHREGNWKYVLNSIPAIASGLGSWTGFDGESILFPVLTALIWGGITFLILSIKNE